jgi:hypothetical protein
MEKSKKEMMLQRLSKLDAVDLKLAVTKVLRQAYETSDELGEFMDLGHYRVEAVEVVNALSGIIGIAEETK